MSEDCLSTTHIRSRCMGSKWPKKTVEMTQVGPEHRGPEKGKTYDLSIGAGAGAAGWDSDASSTSEILTRLRTFLHGRDPPASTGRPPLELEDAVCSDLASGPRGSIESGMSSGPNGLSGAWVVHGKWRY